MPSKSQDLVNQTKQVVYSVYRYFKHLVLSDPTATVQEVFSNTQHVTAQACSLSVRSVQRITAEGNKDKEENCAFSSPQKKKEHKKWVTDLDEFDLDVVRRTVFEFYDRKEFVTCEKMRSVLKDKIGFAGGKTSTWKVLKKAGFSFRKCNDGRRFLMERDDIVMARLEFLRRIHEVKNEPIQRPIVYLDETWVNQNHSKKYIWQDEACKGGLRVPVGKGRRLIVCHAGSEKFGFVEGAKLVFLSKGSGDYHQEMNGDVFKEWFVDMLRGLEEGCVVVMDNASYHSKLKEEIPTSKTKKADIIEWLKSKGIPHDPSHTVRELHSIVRLHRENYKKYELDEIALEMGHEVLRLPPYHCQYNPIELIWAKVKREVAENNSTFKIQDVRRLLEEALERVSKEDWANCVQHCNKIQEDDFAKEIGERDNYIQQIIVNLEDDTSDSDSDYDTSDEV
jgi:transposase